MITHLYLRVEVQNASTSPPLPLYAINEDSLQPQLFWYPSNYRVSLAIIRRFIA
jgi:hypothetical protein